MASIRGRELRFPIDPDGLVDFCTNFDKHWSPYLWDCKVKRLRKMLKQVSGNHFLLNLYSYVINKYIQDYFGIVIAPRYSGLNGSRFSPNMDQLIDQLIDDLTQFKYDGYWMGSSLLDRKEMYYNKIPIDDIYRLIGDFWKNVIEDICIQQGGKKAFVEDNTLIILCFDTILKLTENAKLVHIYRDPRDVVASYINMKWSPKSVEQASYWYKGIINEWITKKEILPIDSFIELRLEDLVDNPHDILHSICEFWEINWDDRLLDTKLNQSNTGRWHAEFSEKDKIIVNNILKDEISYLGY